MTDSPKIEGLGERTRSILRSTQILTSLAQIVAELVQNALDANASHIDVGVDCEEWSCWVRDDGVGMNKENLSQIAQESGMGRYTTSKAYDMNSLGYVSTFGFRGEAIASVVDLCCVEISSRTKFSKDNWSVIMRGGETLYNGPSVRWRRESQGTSVIVRDAFYNLPIRRLSHPNSARTFDTVRQQLESCALAFPSVSFTLQNSEKERKAGPSKGNVLSIPKTQSSVATFRHLFGRALVEHVNHVNVQSKEITLEGFISLVGANTKAYQYLYVNNHLLKPCKLHNLIEQKFLSSSFAKHAYDELGSTKFPRPASRRSPRKAEKRPVYVLNVHLSAAHIDNCVEPSKTTINFQNNAAVQSLIMDTIKSFLLRHGFSSEQMDQKVLVCEDHWCSPCKKRKKTMGANEDPALMGIECNTEGQNDESKMRNLSNDVFVQEEHLNENGKNIVWTDASTGQTYLIDPRTGNSSLRGLQMQLHEEDTTEEILSRARGRSIVDTRFLNSAPNLSRSCESDTTPPWILDALTGNQSFRSSEPDICRGVAHIAALLDDQDRKNKSSRRSIEQNYHDLSCGESVYTDSCTLSKDDLARSRILGQIDNKFIACFIDLAGVIEETAEDAEFLTDGRILILVDQHAADERVRVETLLTDLCRGFFSVTKNRIVQRNLEPPKPVLLTQLERSHLVGNAEFLEAFSSWGFCIDHSSSVTNPDVVSDYVQVSVRSVPEVVGDKLLSGDVLRDLVKGYIARLQTEGFHKDIIQNQYRDCELDWLSALRWCPKELVDLINSKACRGAIMFNDPLTNEQCRSLIRRLSETRFPFICAHGRPSVVPLANRPAAHIGSRKIDWAQLEL